MEMAMEDEYTSPLHSHVGTEVIFTGTLVAPPDIRQRTQHLLVSDGEDTILVFADRFESFVYGDQVTVTGTLTLPESFITDLGRTFDYRGYLKARGVEYTIPFGEVVVLSRAHGNPILRELYEVKDAFMNAINTHVRSPQSALGVGLLLGVKQALPDDLERAFRKAGVIHIVVLSGYNIMLVVTFVMYVFALFLPFRARVVCGLCAITLFALLVGPSATVIRASCMAGLLLVAKLTGRTYDVLRALCVVGIVMLLLNPYLLVYDVGFQLSFVATLGLITLSVPLERFVRFIPSLGGMRGFLTATIATQILVTPLLLYQIGEFSVVAVIVNLLVLPMVPIAMLLTFGVGMVGIVLPVLAPLCAFFAHLSLSYIIVISQWFAELPFSAFVVPAFPLSIMLLAYGMYAGIYLYIRHTRSPEHTGLNGWTIVDEDTYRKSLQ